MCWGLDVDRVSWCTGVLGRRLTAWMGHGCFLLQWADTVFVDAFMGSLVAQWLHLQRTASDARLGIEQLSALLGIVYGAMAMPGEDNAVAKGMRQLEHLVASQILKDGGYISRAPSDLMAALRRLIALREAGGESGRPVSG